MTFLRPLLAAFALLLTGAPAVSAALFTVSAQATDCKLLEPFFTINEPLAAYYDPHSPTTFVPATALDQILEITDPCKGISLTLTDQFGSLLKTEQLRTTIRNKIGLSVTFSIKTYSDTVAEVRVFPGSVYDLFITAFSYGTVAASELGLTAQCPGPHVTFDAQNGCPLLARMQSDSRYDPIGNRFTLAPYSEHVFVQDLEVSVSVAGTIAPLVPVPLPHSMAGLAIALPLLAMIRSKKGIRTRRFRGSRLSDRPVISPS